MKNMVINTCKVLHFNGKYNNFFFSVVTLTF